MSPSAAIISFVSEVLSWNISKLLSEPVPNEILWSSGKAIGFANLAAVTALPAMFSL